MTIDWNAILLALIGSIPALIVAWRTGKRVDGRMDEMLSVTRSEAGAKAVVAEKDAQSAREIEALRVRQRTDPPVN